MAPVACPAGYYNNAVNKPSAPACLPCPVGYKCLDKKSRVKCTKGSSLGLSTTCDDTSGGATGGGGGDGGGAASVNILCPRGFFCPDAEKRFPCPSGTYGLVSSNEDVYKVKKYNDIRGLV